MDGEVVHTKPLKKHTALKITGAIILGIVIFFTAAFTDPSLKEGRIDHGTSRELNVQVGGGVQYKSDLHNFSIWFPEHPDYQTRTELVPETDISLTAHTYGAQNETGLQYMAIVIGVPGMQNGTTTDADLDLMVDGAIGNLPSAELVGKEYVIHGDYRGVTMETEDKTVGYKAKWLLMPYENETISIAILAEDGDVDEKKFSKFMESFTYGE